MNNKLLDINKYLEKWNLDLDGDVQETNSSLVACVKYRNTKAVLKIPKPGSGEENMAAIIQDFNSHAMVEILQHDEHALLLKRIMPGTTLVALSRQDDLQATKIICKIIKDLHQGQKELGSARKLAHFAPAFVNYINYSATKFTKDRHERKPNRAVTSKLVQADAPAFVNYLESSVQTLNRQLVQDAYNIFNNLCANQGREILVHGDLHHENILYCQEQNRYIAIDPKGIIAEAEYEIGAMLRNPLPFADIFANEQIFNNRVDVICSELGYDRDKVIKWAFIQSILACIWSIEDNNYNQDTQKWLEFAMIVRNKI